MLMELKVVEQRYRAVTDVLDGMNVTEVARLNGVARQNGAHLGSPLCVGGHGGPRRPIDQSRSAVRTR